MDVVRVTIDRADALSIVLPHLVSRRDELLAQIRRLDEQVAAIQGTAGEPGPRGRSAPAKDHRTKLEASPPAAPRGDSDSRKRSGRRGRPARAVVDLDSGRRWAGAREVAATLGCDKSLVAKACRCGTAAKGRRLAWADSPEAERSPAVGGGAGEQGERRLREAQAVAREAASVGEDLQSDLDVSPSLGANAYDDGIPVRTPEDIEAERRAKFEGAGQPAAGFRVRKTKRG